MRRCRSGQTGYVKAVVVSTYGGSNPPLLIESKMERKINKTKIEKRMKCKLDNLLVETIIKLKKTNPELAKELAKPKRRWPAINLKDISMIEGDVVVAGKVLSAGDLEKPKKIVAWSASEKAIDKMKEIKAEFSLIIEEIKNNPELKGLNIVR
jgi:ribosomal protein L18E